MRIFRTMTLQEFLTQKGVTQAEFAASIGASQSTISRLMDGSLPRLELMKRIYVASNGAVTPNDWLPMQRSINK
jgi:transcriptional regulator with XRE-family HTH domain